MKLKYTYLFLLSAVMSVLLIAAFSEGSDAEEVKGNEKIIKFSHSFHADLAACADCHKKAANSTSLKDRLMPDHEDCGTCHDVEDAEKCGTCHYDDVNEPLIQKSSNMIFNHSFHVNDKKMDCEVCHKGVKEVDYAAQAKQPNPVMADCYTCHNDVTSAPNACESCHLNTTNLVPQSHKDVAFIKTHKFEANDVNADCVMCHDNNNNNCQDCHAAEGIDASVSSTYQPYAPNTFSDGARKQRVNRVHEMGYRFFHGIDARANRAECESCHETVSFCQSCHQDDKGDIAMTGIVPASHLKQDFINPAGGGEHSRLAKRDIESCASCHDVQGADPSCMSCHIDFDGIKGNNPKTHAVNFMKDVEGDWHNDQGSVCFNCHTPSIAGTGFCGYCHGSK